MMRKECCEGSLLSGAQNARLTRDRAGLEEACAQSIVLEARAAAFDRCKNLIVPLGGIKGVIPYYECAVGLREGTARDIAVISRVGKPVCFLVTGFAEDENGQPVVVLSRRAAQQTYADDVVALLVPGDILPCRVTHVERFGCFIDIGRGITALLPLDAIAVSRVAHPGERLRAGDALYCAVRARDERGRIVLTHKELLGTFAETAAGFSAGETVTGIVRSVEAYGVFIELTPNLTGLAEPFDGAQAGLAASVYIKSILPDKLKVKLAVTDVYPLPPAQRGFSYFFTGEHIDRFVYSPPGCVKTVETVFLQD
ncbi:MAG: S1 RNA-binding domain-containing protein [Oscillospiraceae bacterium]|nr:S1 RNA-binding domain-containing protein [Oscillospiraceae bacterium]